MLQFLPHGVALLRRQVLIFVHPVLEFVDHAAVGNKVQAVLAVGQFVFRSVLAEEILVVILGQEFHAHGVTLAGLDGRLMEIRIDVGMHGTVKCKGVAGLVGQNIHVIRGAVEVGENKRHLVGRERGAVATGCLAVTGENVEHLAVEHGLDEFPGLRAEILIHGLARSKDLLRRSLRLGVAVGEAELIVVDAQSIHADTLALGFLDLGDDGHQIRGDLVAELLQFLCAVAVAAQTVIAQLDVVVVAQHSALGVAVFHQLVIDLVQLLPVGIEDLALSLKGCAADGAIRAFLVLAQHGKRHSLAVKLHRQSGVELLILSLQLAGLLHKGNQLRLEAAAGDFQILEKQAAVVGFQLFAVGGIQQGDIDSLLTLLQLRADLIKELTLTVVEFVSGIDGVADIGDGACGHKVFGKLRRFIKGGNLRLHGVRCADLFRAGVQLGLDFLHIGSHIGHFRKLHMYFSFTE